MSGAKIELGQDRDRQEPRVDVERAIPKLNGNSPPLRETQKWRFSLRIWDSKPYQRMVAATVDATKRKATMARLPAVP